MQDLFCKGQLKFQKYARKSLHVRTLDQLDFGLMSQSKPAFAPACRVLW